MKQSNPFSIVGYNGPDYFCDRKEETQKLMSAAENSRPIVLSSMRRIGKTGLINHFQQKLQKTRKWICIYVDMLDTSSDREFINKLISGSLLALEDSKGNLIQKAFKVFGRFNPKIAYDSLTGNPSIELNFSSKTEMKISLEALFKLLSSNKKRIQISIDEYQQISNYKDKTKLDASLRTLIQENNSIHILFSGSQKHLLTDLFSNAKKPMYNMVQHLEIDSISYPKYFEFIERLFLKENMDIDDNSIHEILTWTRSHTYYTQYLCNRIYSNNFKSIDVNKVKKIEHDILKEQELTFINFKNILSRNQFKVLKGIAVKEKVNSVRTMEFISENKIAGSTAKQSLDFLLEVELVYEKYSIDSSLYYVYDVFFSRWLQTK